MRPTSQHEGLGRCLLSLLAYPCLPFRFPTTFADSASPRLAILALSLVLSGRSQVHMMIEGMSAQASQDPPAHSTL